MNNKSFIVYFRSENIFFLNQLRSYINELNKRFNEAGLALKGIVLIDNKLSLSKLDEICNFERKINIKI